MRPSMTSPARIPTGDLLHRTLALLEAAAFPPDATAPRPAPRLVAVAVRQDKVHIGFLPVPGDPLEQLQGFIAPPTWTLLGYLGTGEARELEPSADDGPPGPRDAPGALTPVTGAPGSEVDVIHLVDRRGRSVSLHRRVGQRRGVRSEGDGEGWCGLLDDHLRLALGLPTPAAPPSTLPLWTAWWLDELVAAALTGDLDGESWSGLAARHPAARLAAEADTGPQVLTWVLQDVVRAGELLAGTWTWPVLREAARSGRDVLGGTPPALAGWLDDGTFARLQLARLPPTTDLLAVLDDVLPAPLARRLTLISRAWGIQT